LRSSYQERKRGEIQLSRERVEIQLSREKADIQLSRERGVRSSYQEREG
jgi:hypothetical protein